MTRRNDRHPLLFASLFSIALSAACGGASGTGESDDDGAPAATAPRDCLSRCESKARACSQDAARCSLLCGACPSEAELMCLESSPCSALAQSRSVCGVDPDRKCGGGRDAGTASSGRDAGTSIPVLTGPPTTLAISGRLKGYEPTAVLSDDKKTLAYYYAEEARPVTFEPALTPYEAPKLEGASSIKVISPPLGACTATLRISASNTSKNVILSLGGTETLPATPCLDWTKAVKSKGLSMEFVDAPYSNGVKAKVQLKLQP